MTSKLGLALLLLTAGCGDDTASRPDAGSDAARDAGHDAGARDAGMDAATSLPDAALRDAGPDASGWYDEAEWQALEDVPAPCVVERARRPEVLYGAEWVSCGDGCERFIEDARYQQAYDSEGGWHDGTRGYFWVVARAWEDPLARRMLILVTTDGEALGAWRGPSAFAFDGVCQVGPSAVSDGTAVFAVHTRIDGASRFLVYHAPVEEIAEQAVPFGALDDPGLTRVFASTTTVAVELQAAGVVQVFEEDRTARLGRTPAVPGAAHEVALVGHDVFFSEYGARWRAAHGTIDQPATPWIDVPSADVRALQVDGESFAWLQCYDRASDGSYGRVELWTAPYTNDPATLVPRLVREMEH